jgi:hypothetical protein
MDQGAGRAKNKLFMSPQALTTQRANHKGKFSTEVLLASSLFAESRPVSKDSRNISGHEH